MTAHPGTVLLVEDEEPVRRLTERILIRSGYRVLPAGDGAEALRLAGENRQPGQRIDVLLTDLAMPGMSGRELAERIGVSQPEIAVVYMSGSVDDEAAASGDDRPSRTATAQVQKPFTAGALLEAVERVRDRGAGS